MFYLRDLPKYDAIRARAARYPEVDAGAIEAYLVLMRVGSDVVTALDKYLALHNISQGSFIVLMLLNREPTIGLNPSDLAAKSGVTRATMTGLLDGLERKKLVRRHNNQADRRTVLVHLTDQGINLLEGILHDYYRKIALLMEGLTGDEKRQLSDMLLKISHGIPHIHPLPHDGDGD